MAGQLAQLHSRSCRMLHWLEAAPDNCAVLPGRGSKEDCTDLQQNLSMLFCVIEALEWEGADPDSGQAAANRWAEAGRAWQYIAVLKGRSQGPCCTLPAVMVAPAMQLPAHVTRLHFRFCCHSAASRCTQGLAAAHWQALRAAGCTLLKPPGCEIPPEVELGCEVTAVLGLLLKCCAHLVDPTLVGLDRQYIASLPTVRRLGHGFQACFALQRCSAERQGCVLRLLGAPWLPASVCLLLPMLY